MYKQDFDITELTNKAELKEELLCSQRKVLYVDSSCEGTIIPRTLI